MTAGAGVRAGRGELETIPAEFAVRWSEPSRPGRVQTVLGGRGAIYACSWHLAQAIRVLRANTGGPVTVDEAVPEVHGCKGHLEQWPVPGRP